MMTEPRSMSLRTGASHQNGIALVVVLVFLLALTAISLYGARQAVFGEKIARNVLDGQVAHQAAEAALRDAEADIAMPEGNVPANAFCQRPGMRPVAAHMAMLVAGSDCLGGMCKLTSAEYEAVNYAPPSPSADGASAVAKGMPWWADDKGGKWNNDLSTKPAAVNQNCSTFIGGVPLGTFTGVTQMAGVSQQPEYLIEYIGLRSQRPLFRITARGFGYDRATQAVVQSYYVPPETE